MPDAQRFGLNTRQARFFEVTSLLNWSKTRCYQRDRIKSLDLYRILSPLTQRLWGLNRPESRFFELYFGPYIVSWGRKLKTARKSDFQARRAHKANKNRNIFVTIPYFCDLRLYFQVLKIFMKIWYLTDTWLWLSFGFVLTCDETSLLKWVYLTRKLNLKYTRLEYILVLR